MGDAQRRVRGDVGARQRVVLFKNLRCQARLRPANDAATRRHVAEISSLFGDYPVRMVVRLVQCSNELRTTDRFKWRSTKVDAAACCWCLCSLLLCNLASTPACPVSLSMVLFFTSKGTYVLPASRRLLFKRVWPSCSFASVLTSQRLILPSPSTCVFPPLLSLGLLLSPGPLTAQQGAGQG